MYLTYRTGHGESAFSHTVKVPPTDQPVEVVRDELTTALGGLANHRFAVSNEYGIVNIQLHPADALRLLLLIRGTE